MEQVLLTALGVGGATVFGALIGYIFKGLAEKYGNIILSFASGVMLFASVTGLILPALEFGGVFANTKALVGIFVGGFCVLLPEYAFPSLRQGGDINLRSKKRALLTVFAIALHNLPEGIAAGVGFGAGDIKSALFIALGIALQNIPEGCVVVAPLVGIGVKPRRAFLIAAFTGIIEIFGTLLGYFAVSLSALILPYALSFAAGAMLYVVFCEMMPEISADTRKTGILAAFLFGVGIMVAIA